LEFVVLFFSYRSIEKKQPSPSGKKKKKPKRTTQRTSTLDNSIKPKRQQYVEKQTYLYWIFLFIIFFLELII